MARERMVTRTIASAKAEVKIYDLEKDEVRSMYITVTGTTNTKEVEQHVARRLSKTTTVRYLTIKSIEVTEKLYAMTEVEFLKHAVEIQPGAVKVPEK